jgi:hypothetical protein
MRKGRIVPIGNPLLASINAAKTESSWGSS